MNKPPGAARFYSPQIDGLRFAAAFLVYFHHAPALPYLYIFRPYGWVGVDLFLAISAFLLTKLLVLEHRANGNIDVTAFFLRRILRIWPLYFGFASAACAYALWKGVLDGGEIAGWWVSHLAMVNNLVTALNGYSPIPYSAHLWTISLEEQVYLALPFILLFLLARGVGRAGGRIVLAIISILAAMRLSFALLGAPHPFIWVLPLRADPIIFGAAAALLVSGRELRRPNLILVAGALLMAAGVSFPGQHANFWFQLFGYPIIGLGAAMIAAALVANAFASHLLAMRPLAFLGKISFGIYVYHLVAIAIARALWRLDSSLDAVIVFALGFAITVMLATISYYAFEIRFLKLKRRFTVIRSRPL